MSRKPPRFSTLKVSLSKIEAKRRAQLAAPITAGEPVRLGVVVGQHGGRYQPGADSVKKAIASGLEKAKRLRERHDAHAALGKVGVFLRDHVARQAS